MLLFFLISGNYLLFKSSVYGKNQIFPKSLQTLTCASRVKSSKTWETPNWSASSGKAKLHQGVNYR